MASLQNRPEMLAASVVAGSAELQIHLKDGRNFTVPYSGWPTLAAATANQRANFRLVGDGEGIHWPDIDEDLSVGGLFQDFALPSKPPLTEVPYLIAELYKVTQRLNDLFPGRPFTPDGHLVGSIGEVVAEYVYDLRLEKCSTPQIDARTSDLRQTVQIKLTGERGKSYGFRWSRTLTSSPPDLLICLRLTKAGFEEVYAGRFPVELLAGRSDSSNGQLAISTTKLSAVNPSTILQVRPLRQLNELFKAELEAAA